MKWFYITGTADSVRPLAHGNDKHVDWLSAFELWIQHHRVISADRHPTPYLFRPVGYFCPVLTADGKLDCAPK
jgi:hypothetical protein